MSQITARQREPINLLYNVKDPGERSPYAKHRGRMGKCQEFAIWIVRMTRGDSDRLGSGRPTDSAIV